MDHSLTAYLGRRTTAELTGILRYCLLQREKEYYATVVQIVYSILLERSDAKPPPLDFPVT